MSGVVVDFQPATDIIDAINQTIAQSPALMLTSYKRNTTRLLSRWKAALRIQPASAQNYYPVHWKSAKQRRAFFATNGFGGGIPYQRTGALARGWQGSVDAAEDGGALTVYNTAPEAGYVYGDFGNPRQPMFDGLTGGVPWLDPFTVSAPYFDEAEEVLIQTWFTIVDEKAGVP